MAITKTLCYMIYFLYFFGIEISGSNVYIVDKDEFLNESRSLNEEFSGSGSGETTTLPVTTQPTTSIDECYNGISYCPENSYCKVKERSYECLCYTGFEKINEECIKIKQFTGLVVLTGAKTLSKALTDPTTDDIKDLLSCIYCEDTTTEVCFKDATVKASSNGLDFSYRLLYDETITIDLNDIKEKMEADLNKCNKDSIMIDEEATINEVGTVQPSLACPGCYNDSTECIITNDGYSRCICREGYYEPIGATSIIICTAEICLSDADCNSPFGTCQINSDPKVCSCMATFSGTSCENPWLFIFIIVVSFLVVSIVPTTIWFIYSNKKKPKKAKYLKDEIYLQQLNVKKLPARYPNQGLRAKVPPQIPKMNMD